MPHSILRDVCDAARAAGRAILEVRAAAAVEIRHKPDGPVTNADMAANALLESALRALAPDAAWLSEETADSPERLGIRRVWVVDPLDGTQEFIQGTADFGVSIGLVEGDRPVLGVLYFPVHDETLYAVRGQGAFARVAEAPPHPIHVRRAPGPLVLATRRADMRKPWMQVFAKGLGDAVLKPVGSTIRKIALVARGDCDAYVTRNFAPFEWDVCAADVVLGEAGGIVTLPSGDVPRYNRPDARLESGIVACRADLRDTIASLLAMVDPRP